jgi:acetyl-CoA carboxylase biotin carboxylase subunit
VNGMREGQESRWLNSTEHIQRMKNKRIEKLLVSNRGEIALRIIRACRELGIRSVAVYSDIDRKSLHVLSADEAYPLGGSSPRESYLDQSKIITIAQKASADAIHPGYGFLAENPAFADAVVGAGLIFIGPSGESIRRMGDKTEARKAAQRLGIPTISGTLEPILSTREGVLIAENIGFPVLLKAAAGGGGKGMRVVKASGDFESALRAAQSEARGAFGDDRVYLEKYLDSPRHIEMQIIADTHGNVVYLGERECSIQRRHQKIIEESPSPAVGAALRAQLGEAAVLLAKAAGYVNAGTIEFLLDSEGRFYFLEMNTRLQVEHPVTEAVTGLDLVHLQVRIAEGDRLPVSQEGVEFGGHAIECRVCAEDPESSFMPSTGVLQRYHLPQGRIRLENGFREGDEISIHYDSLLAKVIAWGETRNDAIRYMESALHEFGVEGVKTTIPFCQNVLAHESFIEGSFDTHFIEKNFETLVSSNTHAESMWPAAIAALLLKGRIWSQADNRSELMSGSSNWRASRRDSLT